MASSNGNSGQSNAGARGMREDSDPSTLPRHRTKRRTTRKDTVLSQMSRVFRKEEWTHGSPLVCKIDSQTPVGTQDCRQSPGHEFHGICHSLFNHHASDQVTNRLMAAIEQITWQGRTPVQMGQRMVWEPVRTSSSPRPGRGVGSRQVSTLLEYQYQTSG